MATYFQTMRMRVLLFAVISCSHLKITAGTCDYHERPRDRRLNGTMHRLGKTRFFLHFGPGPGSHLGKFRAATWNSWTQYCRRFFHESAHLPLYLDKISTNALIARFIEHTVVKKNITYYTYWIGSKQATIGQGDYMWYSGGSDAQQRPLRYSNIFYKAPQVIGAGRNSRKLSQESKEVGMDHVHEEERRTNVNFCMAFALPFQNDPNYGWQTSWVQRDCEYAASGICELPMAECDENINLNPHVLTEDKEYYYTDGNWIFANRRFIVNWKPRNSWEARKYCSDYNLDVFTPTLEDLCLVPYLKMWGIVLNTYQFWTSYNYDPADRSFRTQNGNVIQRGAKASQKYLAGRARAQRNEPQIFNVSYVWTYERSNETRCQGIGCKWMYYVLAPIYHTMYVGTICQHKEIDNSRSCDFEVSWNQDFTQGLATTAIVEFGYKGSGIWRSAYKQTFKNHICDHDDRQMAGIDTDYWSDVKPAEVEFIYDYLETYWVVDEGLFEHEGKHEPLCSVSNLTMEGDTFKRALYKVNCDEWHFYLCELIF